MGASSPTAHVPFEGMSGDRRLHGRGGGAPDRRRRCVDWPSRNGDLEGMDVVLVAAREQECAGLAIAWAERSRVELLTVCGWGENRFGLPGVDREGGLTRRVFRADFPEVPLLEKRLRERVEGGGAEPGLQEKWIRERGPYSSALLDHLAGALPRDAVLVFVGLAHATTVFGLRQARRPSILVPALQSGGEVLCELLQETLARADAVVFADRPEEDRLGPWIAEGCPRLVAGCDEAGRWDDLARSLLPD